MAADKNANWLFRQPCEFMLGVTHLDALPTPDKAEFAFAGRSNVGKSSLLNALVHRKNLARSSNTPGRTRELNFFDLDGHLRLVDLPGYGFARASRTEVKKWQNLADMYLRGRVNLRRVFLLIDARHGLKPIDHEALTALGEAAVSTAIILTKSDKLNATQREAVVQKTEDAFKQHPIVYPEIFLTSSEKRTGLEAIREHIASAL